MGYTRAEWREIADDKDFDEHACLVHKGEFVAILRELLDENRDMLAALLAAPDPPPPNTAWEEQYVVWHCMSRKPVVAARGGAA